MIVIKATGRRESFSREKLLKSLLRVGIREDRVNQIIDEVLVRLKGTVKSSQILDTVLDIIRKEEPEAAAKYRLKSAIMNLGPSGYPFEKYFARVLDNYGYKTETGVRVKGYCADQEVDVVATKGGIRLMIECKYHNLPGARSDLKVSLYTYARFLDVKEAWERSGEEAFFHKAVLVTNTKCTSEAIKFARCRGVDVIAWQYPKSMNLQDMIEEKNLYPITILLSLNDLTRDKLLRKGIVFAQDIVNREIDDLASQTGVAKGELKTLQREAKLIYSR